MAVTDFGAAAQRLFNAVRRDQVDPARVKGGLHQILIGSKRDGVGFRIDLCHVAAMGGRYPEPAPLAQRIMDDSLMTPQYIALSVNKISGRTVTAAVTADKAGVVTVRDKADILAVFFFSVPEAALRGDLSRRVLVLVPQRELYMGQLVLGHHIEDIALVLGGIEGFEQKVPAGLRIIFGPGIMSRDQKITSKFFHLRKQMLKLQLPVAFNAGIGRMAMQIFIDERLDHFLAEKVFIVYDMVGNTDPFCYAASVLCIFKRAACIQQIHAHSVILIEPHGAAHAFISA